MCLSFQFSSSLLPLPAAHPVTVGFQKTAPIHVGAAEADPRKTKFQIKTLNGKSINAERAENCIFGSFYVRANTHQGHINKIANMSSSESVAQSVTQVPSLALRDGIKGEICIMTPGRYIVIIIVLLFNGCSAAAFEALAV